MSDAAAGREPLHVRLRNVPDTRDANDLEWFAPAFARLRSLPRETDPRLRAFFADDAPVLIARAPGRLDVMGGIADYSGAQVLELPLACSTVAVLQTPTTARCDLATCHEGRWHFFSMDLPPVVEPGGALGTQASLAAWFATHPDDRWAAYVLGVVQLLMQRAAGAGHHVPQGLRLLIDSTVPPGRGLASSAALEVAVGAAVAGACGDVIAGAELAALCQSAENRVVGAPCGIMDQMTSACGQVDRLLQLRCQPGTIEAFLSIPGGYRVYGIDSCTTHSVSGAEYTTARTAAFMGYRMIAALAGLPAARDGARIRIDDARWRGYLANLTPDEFSSFARDLPEEMSGEEFLGRYDGITDTATTVLAGRRYPIRRATEHPVREQARVARFRELLATLADQPGTAVELGRLMYASHQSYGACGLGSRGTDRLVDLVAAQGPERGLFGAKITGGGSGGTVAVLGTERAEPLVRELAARYGAEQGVRAEVYTGSGPGAVYTGVLRLRPRDIPPNGSS